jgi:polysaccharide pyruvyl transferase WcaK-like protein
MNTVLKLGIPAEKVLLVPDAVFANSADVFLSKGSTIQPRQGKTRIALNLNYDIENRNAWEPFLDKLVSALTKLNEMNPIEIHALPMQSKFKENDDLSVLKDFSTRIPNIPFQLHDPQTAQEAAEVMAGCDLIVAERLHTLVIASIIGLPFFGLVYDVKVQELVDYLGMSDHSININQPFDLAPLYEGIDTVIKNSPSIREHLLTRSTLLRAKLTTYFDDLKTKIFIP